jgi:hypothetical protein
MKPFSRPAPLWWRLAAVGLGISILLWLPIEDTHEHTSTLIAVMVSFLLATRTLLPCSPQNCYGIIRHAGVGLLAGLAITPFTLFMVAIKTGLHDHNVPDFTADQITTVLIRTPAWLLSGLLIGFGVGVWRYSQNSAAT